MLTEPMRKRLPAERASFIEPCLPSPADKPPSGSNWRKGRGPHQAPGPEISAMKWTDRIDRRLRLNDLHILVSVAEIGSMGKAAEALGISQPSVSKASSDIEHAMGVRLLDRSEHGVLTPYGQALINRGISAFDEVAQGLGISDFVRPDSRLGVDRMS
jgi:hypothetical protein